MAAALVGARQALVEGPAASSSDSVSSPSSVGASAPYRNSVDGNGLTPPSGWRFRPIDPHAGVSSVSTAPTLDSTGQKAFTTNINVIVVSTTDDLDKTIAVMKPLRLVDAIVVAVVLGGLSRLVRAGSRAGIGQAQHHV